MQVETPYASLNHSDLALGSFFWLLRHQPLLCLKVMVRDAPGNVIFEKNEQKGGFPWVSVDEFPDDEPVIALRNGILRPDAETVAANGYEAPPLGALVSHADIYLIGAGAGRGRSMYFDLSTGANYPAFREGRGVHYRTWSIGAVRDQQYWEAYRFPSLPKE